MGRIKQITDSVNQKGRKLLIPYLVAGDPNKETTIELMHALVSNGADIIELGIPFSDPSSDGEVIQSGIERSLRKGTSLNDTLDIVSKFRARNEVTPIVLMGYLNPVEIMGVDNFVRRAQKEGVDGVLMVDMPPAEAGVLNAKLKEVNIDSIFLVAPTTTQERIKSILNMTSGYVYYVSLKGVTGASITDVDEVERNVCSLRSSTDLPIVVGFGIKDGKSAKAMARVSDGVIVGSALVNKIASLTSHEKISAEDIKNSTNIIKEIREELDLDNEVVDEEYL
tara:strand:- start:397 stop:1239 length:843 start_codon:yes stop_codon:yes gene_type:complete